MKTFLGRWNTPSGNSCEVSTVQDDRRRKIVNVSWDKHPLDAEDKRFYQSVVLPVIIAAVEEASALS